MSFIRPLLPSPASAFTSARTRSGRPAPTLVVDLDDTVMHRTRGLLDAALVYGLPPSLAARHVGVPYAGALDALHELARVYRIVALTARWAAGARYTDAWLALHGLAGLPVIVARAPHPGDDSRVAFKAAAIAWLQGEGWAPIAGVGDRPSDLEAYAACGLHACVVAHRPPGAQAEGGASRDDAECWRVLRAAAARESKLVARSGGGEGGGPRVAYFSDSAGVHAAAAALAPEGEAEEEARPAGGMRVPPPLRIFPLGQEPPLAMRLHVPRGGGKGGAGAALPHVWESAQLRGYLQELAKQEEEGGSSNVGRRGGAK